MYVYGINGIIIEVEMLLIVSYDWVDVLVGFDDFMDVVCFFDVLVNLDGLLIKNIVFVVVFVFYDYFLWY